jgi:hypothetical protein
MKYLLSKLLVILCFTTILSAADNGKYFVIKGTSYKPGYDKLEVLGVFLHEDGEFVDEGGDKEPKKDFLKTIELARKHPPQFKVELILFPTLKSNNDWKLIKQWCIFFDKHKIPWIITVWPDNSLAPQFLYKNPPKDAPKSIF